MRLRWLSLLPLVVLAAACAVPDDSRSEDVDNDVEDHLALVDSPDSDPQPLPDLATDGVDDELNLSQFHQAVVEEEPLVLSGGTCVTGGLYCGGDKLSGNKSTLYRCNGKGTPTVVKNCSAGCSVNPGKDDSCKAPPASTCTIFNAPHASYLDWGLHPDASDALQHLKFPAGRIMQTIGSASASAGTHGQDGTSGGHAYSAATDLSVKGMTDAQVHTLLTRLTSVGFAAYYRNPGHNGWPASEARHVHAIWTGAAMKHSLRDQMRDWHVGRNGLASHLTYTFYTWSSCWRSSLWTAFDAHNSATN